MDSSRQTVVSAPGKVLIAGGYLVLEATYPGVVISTSARFYTSIRGAHRSEEASTSAAVNGGSASRERGSLRVSIRSPQFTEAHWEYVVRLDVGRGLVEQTKETYESANAGPNPFISLALLYSIRLALEVRSIDEIEQALCSQDLGINIVADNDFYSQRQDGKASSSSQLRDLPPFTPQRCPISKVHKTGLGSSAAMTTSLVGALLSHLGVVASDGEDGQMDDTSLALIHNTAQLAHCAAQGKVGSGFDVSAAVWGSHLYRRFDKRVLQTLLDAGEKVQVVGSARASAYDAPELAPFLDPRNPLWKPSPMSSSTTTDTSPTAVEGLSADNETSQTARPAPLELPPHVELILADVDAGSNTPSMVGKILAWKKAKPEWADQIYKLLATGNQTLADGLLALRLAHAQDSKEYQQALLKASRMISREWDTLAKVEPSPTLILLREVRNAMRSIQGGMRELGRQADVPVEPNEMGNVIRATIDGAPGVIGGGVPGAGGYDALFLLYLDVSELDPSTTIRRDIEQVWTNWQALSVGPLLSSAGGASGSTSSAVQAQAALSAFHIPDLSPSKMRGGMLFHKGESEVAGLAEAIGMASSR